MPHLKFESWTNSMYSFHLGIYFYGHPVSSDCDDKIKSWSDNTCLARGYFFGKLGRIWHETWWNLISLENSSNNFFFLFSGHPICSDCDDKVKSCPVCRETFGKSPRQTPFAERLILCLGAFLKVSRQSGQDLISSSQFLL